MTTTPHSQRKYSDSDEEDSHPFLPLEESNRMMTPLKNAGGVGTNQDSSSSLSLHPIEQQQKDQQPSQPWHFEVTGKTVVSAIMLILVAILIGDSIFASPEYRLIKPDFVNTFLIRVQAHPSKGAFGLLLLIAFAVVFMIPIGTALALGCGYIYKSAYGWRLGLTIATTVSLGGAVLGAVTCFLLGRYLMRDQVRTWIRNYPLFVAIDVAAAEQGLRIMAMLFWTPILPLGPVSYMCGTTSMALSSFVAAKVASMPIKLFHVFLGASAGALIRNSGKDGADGDEVKDLEENRFLILLGTILLSFVMIVGITHFIKKELNKILDRQKKHRPPAEIAQFESDLEANNEEAAIEIEMAETAPTDLVASLTAPRQRLNSKLF